MDLVRELLDIQVRDCRFRKCGRVDGIVLEVSGSGPPVVAAIEIGGAVLAKRLGGWVERLYKRHAKRLGLRPEPVRIAVAHIAKVDLQLTLDFDASETGDLLRTERAIADATGHGQR